MEPELSPAKDQSSYVSAVWAIDPEEKDLRPTSETLTTVRMFLGGSFERVHPAYVCPHDGALLHGLKSLEEYLAPLNIKPVAELDVIYTPSKLRADWSERIVRRVKHHNAQVILLTSHGRSAVGNFLFGSFAQDLLAISPVPLLVMNSHAAGTIEKVMFTTDLSQGSKNSFFHFLQLVKGKTSEVILFYAIDYPSLTMCLADGVGLPVCLPDSLIEDQKDWADHELNSWGERARNLGIELRLHPVVAPAVLSITDSITKVALAEQISLIGLSSHIGSSGKMALGSITQKLMSNQNFNLCIYGPGFQN